MIVDIFNNKCELIANYTSDNVRLCPHCHELPNLLYVYNPLANMIYYNAGCERGCISVYFADDIKQAIDDWNEGCKRHG